MSGVSSARDGNLDGLRALAALAVVAHHYSGQSFFFLGDLGRFGVTLFFIISGYCVTMSLEHLPPRAVGEFLIRRTFRLYPAYWVAVAIAVASGSFPAPVVLANLTMMQPLFGAPYVNGVFWTLFIELLFYGAVCAFLWFGTAGLRSFASAWVLLTLGALAAATLRRWGAHIPFAHMLFLSLFAMGGSVHLMLRRGLAFRWLWLAATIYLLAVYAVSSMIFGEERVGTEDALSHFGNYALGTTVFLAGLRWRLLGWRPLAYLGGISYGLYLFHLPTYFAILPAIGNPVVNSIAATFVTIGFSAVVHHLVEQPCIRLGRTLAWRRRAVAS